MLRVSSIIGFLAALQRNAVSRPYGRIDQVANHFVTVGSDANLLGAAYQFAETTAASAFFSANAGGDFTTAGEIDVDVLPVRIGDVALARLQAADLPTTQ